MEKRFWPGKVRVQEMLEALDRAQALAAGRAARSASSGLPVRARLDGLVQPVALLVVVYVVEVVADAAAVDRAQPVERVAAGACLWSSVRPDDGGGQRLQIGVGQAVGGGIEHRVARRLAAQRIDARGEVAELADAAGHARGEHDLDDIVDGLLVA